MKTPALLVLSLGLLLGADRPKKGPEPVTAVPGIVKLFDKYSVVAIGEFHGYGELGDLYTALVRDPAFQGKVNDIVIEFASRHNQRILDRYILKCEDVPLDELRRVWRPGVDTGRWGWSTGSERSYSAHARSKQLERARAL